MLIFLFVLKTGTVQIKIQQMKKIPQLYNLSRRQLLSQCEIQVATTDTNEMVVIDKVEKLEMDKVEKLEMMSSSDKMSLLPSNVNY